MRILVCLLFVALSLSGFAAAGDIALPKPRKSGGPPLFEALDARASAGQQNFPSKQLELNDFSTILWAASGLNRDGSKWTVPMGMGKPPYCDIYATLDSGVYRYDWESHLLKQISDRDVRTLLPEQPFAKNAPAAIYIVADGEALAAVSRPGWGAEWGPLLAGAMSQNVYLACSGVNAGTRLLYSIDRDLAKREFKLGPKDEPLFVMVLGKY